MKVAMPALDSKGRPRLPKGSLCTLDVEEIALPPTTSTELVELVEVCPEAAAYFDQMTTLMLI